MLLHSVLSLRALGKLRVGLVQRNTAFYQEETLSGGGGEYILLAGSLFRVCYPDTVVRSLGRHTHTYTNTSDSPVVSTSAVLPSSLIPKNSVQNNGLYFGV